MVPIKKNLFKVNNNKSFRPLPKSFYTVNIGLLSLFLDLNNSILNICLYELCYYYLENMNEFS